MVVNPNSTAPMTRAALEAARAVAGPGVRVVAGDDSRGPASVECHADEVAGAASVLAQVREAEARGGSGGSGGGPRPDAYVVACFGDTGVPAAREVAAGPVVGMSEAALVLAALVAHRFTVVTTPRATLPQADRVVRDLGLGHRCSVHAVDVPVAVLAAHDDDAALLAAVAAAGRRAVEEEGAGALVLGCAGLGHLVAPLQDALGVPVVEGVAAAAALAGALLACGLGGAAAEAARAGGEAR